MAYNNPYSDPYISQHRSPPQQQQQGGYSDESFNPYASDHTQPHQTYDRGAAPGQGYESYGGDAGYRDEPTAPQSRFGGLPQQDSQRTLAQDPYMDPPRVTKETSGFDRDEFAVGGGNVAMQPRTAHNLRKYRTDSHLWTQGGRGRCVGRFCCCSLLVVIFLLISILLTVALFIRPPNINIGSVAPYTAGGAPAFSASGTGLNISLGVNIAVSNPNFFSVAFQSITADIIYPINNTDIGGGYQTNIIFPSNSQHNFTFPFDIGYELSADPGNKIIIDLANKCGLLGSPSNINVNYKITLALKILFVTVSPVIANSFNFACPLTKDDMETFLQSAGINL